MNAAEAYQAFDQLPDAPVDFLAWAASRWGLSGAVKIMDIGCGPGRLLVPMWDLCWSVTGLEPHPEYFQEAQRVASRRSGIEVRNGGLLDLEDHEAYDVIACINDSYHYLLTLEDRRSGLDRMFRAIRQGGAIVLDMANFLWILRHYQSPEPKTIPFKGGQLTRTILHTIDFHQARFIHTDQFCHVDDEGRASEIETTHALAIITFPEVAHLLREVGFVDLEVYPSLRSRSEGPLQGPRMVIAARKPRPPNPSLSGDK